jgi:alpha-methylacyl-CoA racemase
MASSGMHTEQIGSNLFDGGAPFYNVYECADGQWLSVGAIEGKFYRDFVAGLGLADVLPVEGQHDAADWPRQRQLIAATIATRSRAEWCAAFGDHDACVAPVLAPHEAARHPQLAARGVYQSIDGLLHPSPAPRFSRTPGELLPETSTVGEHSAQVLAERGLDPAAFAELLACGAVVQA